MASQPLLDVREVAVEFRTARGLMRAVEGISFCVARGQTVGVVGESGCGKSVTALSILRLIPDPPGRIVAGQILFEGEDLLKASAERLRQLRGNRIAMVFQEPMSALNPVFRVGEQVAEAVRLHRRASRAAARERTLELFGQMGIPAPEQCFSAYPHQLSGGMQQRVLLAMALSCRPDLLIADEPTTALDVTLQAQVLELLARARRESGMAVLLVTHDLGLVAESCDEVLVLYAGQVVEQAPVEACFAAPAHPYTAALLGAVRSLSGGSGPPAEIPGSLPDPHDYPAGCRFAARCPRADHTCREQMPRLEGRGEGRSVRCFHPEGG